MKYFALKAVMYVYYIFGLLSLLGTALTGWSLGGSWAALAQYGYSSSNFQYYAFDEAGAAIGAIIGLMVGAIIGIVFVAFAQIIQLILDMKEEQSEQTRFMQMQINAINRIGNGR